LPLFSKKESNVGKFKVRLGYLIFAIVLDAFSNAVMIDSNMGSAVWMSSAVNISSFLHSPYGTTFVRLCSFGHDC
jgi:hypothetical protein